MSNNLVRWGYLCVEEVTMPDYQMLTELLGLPQVRVTYYELRGRDDIRLTVESTVEAAVCPECQIVSFSLHDSLPDSQGCQV
jgi:hypothetical protein